MTDAELLKTAMGFREGILDGRPSSKMCVMVSLALEGFLNAVDVEIRIAHGSVRDWDHAWLELPDGRVLCATADQFGLTPVYLGPLPADWIREAAR